MALNCIHIFIVTGSFLYWCVMRLASQRFFIHSCIYLRILLISYLATFLGTNSLSVLMCHKAVNLSICSQIMYLLYPCTWFTNQCCGVLYYNLRNRLELSKEKNLVIFWQCLAVDWLFLLVAKLVWVHSSKMRVRVTPTCYKYEALLHIIPKLNRSEHALFHMCNDNGKRVLIYMILVLNSCWSCIFVSVQCLASVTTGTS